MAPVVRKPKPEPVVVQDKYYEVLVDQILGSTTSEGEGNPSTFKPLSGRVTSADLKAAHCDIAWLLKTEQIVELGYAPSN